MTHDQVEALALGDRLAIMRAGRIEQLGTPEQVFEDRHRVRRRLHRHVQPTSSSALTAPGAARTPAQGDARRSPGTAHGRSPGSARGPRPRPRRGQGADPDRVLPATFVDSQFGGRHIDVVVEVGETRLNARVPSDSSAAGRALGSGQPGRRSPFAQGDVVYYVDDRRSPSPGRTGADRAGRRGLIVLSIATPAADVGPLAIWATVVAASGPLLALLGIGLPGPRAAVPPAAPGLRGRGARAIATAFDRPYDRRRRSATVGLGARLAGDRPGARNAAGLGGDPAAPRLGCCASCRSCPSSSRRSPA